MTVRVRFAPSPTGFLHVGGARTALFNWLFARQEDGVFLLRIEDTDPERSTEEHVRAILDGLSWLGLDWDGNPHYQSDGFDRHRLQARQLLERGLAYRDFSEPGEEPRTEGSPDEPHAIRFRVPDGKTSWDDLIHGEVRFENADIEDLVILRRDGTPTYNFAVVSDDAEMEVTHVIRGDDHLSNTPKQILLYEALGRAVPAFGHVPMILGSDGRRLSKRHGATAVEAYAEEGILPEAMVNFLALLGWSPGTDEEVFTVDELRSRFSLDRVLKKSAVFDHDKLEWINGQHLARTPAERLEGPVREQILVGEGQAVQDALEAEGRAWLLGLVDLLKVRHRTVKEIAEKARVYLVDPVPLDPDAVAKRWAKDPEATADHLQAVWKRYSAVEWKEDALEAALRELADELDVGWARLIHPLRVALVGESASPGIFQTLRYVGRERALARIERAIELIRAGVAFEDPQQEAETAR
ncbi:MAG: glutamate--tRNA ligase [Longimicrobiales bacterium]